MSRLDAKPTAAVTSIVPSREAVLEATKFKAFKVSQHLITGLKKTGRAAAWSATGDRLAIASDTGVYLYPSPIHKGKPGYKDVQLTGHTNTVNDVSWHPTDPTILASVSSDKTLKVWDAKNAKLTHSSALSDVGNRVCWSPNAATIQVCGPRIIFTAEPSKFPGGTIKYQKLRQDYQQALYSKDNSIFIVATSSDVKGTAPGVIQIFKADTITSEGRYELSCHTGITMCLAQDKQGKMFASGGADGIINIWDMEEIICTHSICNTDERVNSISFSYDGKLIASACDTQIFVNHVASGEQIYSLKLSALSVAFHPTKYILAITGDDDRNSSQATFARYLEFSA